MLKIKAGPMVTHRKSTAASTVQKVQKTIATYYFALVIKRRAGYGKKLWVLLSMLVTSYQPCNQE